MDRTACTEPQCLYNGYRVFPWGKERPEPDSDPSPSSSAVGHERVELYLYSPNRPYGLYRASVPVQEGAFCNALRLVSRSQWQRGLRRRSVAARLLRLWFRIQPTRLDVAWTFVMSVVCCQVEVSVTGWSVVQRNLTYSGASFVCDLETS